MFQMKKMKKPLVLLLTLIMMFAMSAVAWADVTVNFYDEDTKLWTTQTVKMDQALEARSQFYTETKYPSATNPCGGEASVLDAIIKAIDQINVSQPVDAKLTFTTGWSPETVDEKTGAVYPDGFYLNDIYVGTDGQAGYQAYPTENHYIEDEDGEPNISYGYGWNGYNGTTAFIAYLSNVALTDNMTINFKYESYYYEW